MLNFNITQPRPVFACEVFYEVQRVRVILALVELRIRVLEEVQGVAVGEAVEGKKKKLLDAERYTVEVGADVKINFDQLQRTQIEIGVK